MRSKITVNEITNGTQYRRAMKGEAVLENAANWIREVSYNNEALVEALEDLYDDLHYERKRYDENRIGLLSKAFKKSK